MKTTDIYQTKRTLSTFSHHLSEQDKAESILGNCSIRICLGRVNEGTAKYFSELIGKTTVKVNTGGRREQGGEKGKSSKSSNFSYSQRQLITPDEIMQMDSRTSLIVISGKRSLKSKKSNPV